MILKNIINNCNWKDIQLELIKYYPELKNSLPDFKKVFIELNNLPIVENEFILFIQKVEIEGEDFYIRVSGIGEINELGNSYNISAINWKKWLAMKIHPISLKNFTNAEIIAHSLYEMTFLGFSENEIDSNLEKIEN